MRDLAYISFQYIRYHRIKLLILTLAVSLVAWLPLAVQNIVDQTAGELLTRADRTPLVVGAPGSPLELSLGSLYFRTHIDDTLPYSEVARLNDTGYATAIPLHFRFYAQDHPIVGTTPEYFEFRALQLAIGRPAGILGEAVIGANVAERMALNVGGYIISSPESVFDLAGVYPLRMPVVGILAPSFSPDDDAVFVDVKTSWVIQGLGHGHQDLNQTDAVGAILQRNGDNIVANASVQQYNEITMANIESFHFHGDSADHPISAIIPVTRDDKSRALLLGEYQEERDDVQIVRSQRVVTELLDTVFTVRDYIVVGVTIIAVSTAIIAALVFSLSLRLRRGERFTLARIGASRFQIQALMATEIITVLFFSTLITALLIIITRHYGISLMQTLLVS